MLRGGSGPREPPTALAQRTVQTIDDLGALTRLDIRCSLRGGGSDEDARAAADDAGSAAQQLISSQMWSIVFDG